jgi:ATP-binding cassette subfamily B protein
VAVGLWLSLWIGKRVAHLGRLLETRVRAALLERLPLLGDEYLRSRASSDMANRGHSVHLLRLLPQLWTQLLRAGLTVMALVLTLLWLYPERGLLIVVLGFVSVLVPLVGGRSLTERSLRAQTQLAALDRFYLDALLGAVPVRVHGAERSIQSAHEELLTEWAKTALRLHRDLTLVRGLQLLITVGGAVALVSDFILSVGEMRSLLLLVFLALQLPGAAGELTSATFALRDVRTLALRALAPLAAPVLVPTTHAAESPGSVRAATPGVAIRLAHVHVVAGGHTLLDDISLDIPAGQHWGIVGASGAGKSSLLGLLLGWLQPRDGTVTIDDQTLDGARQVRLRSETAWVDPAVQLWDQNLLDNLTYGDDERVEERLPEALSTADLLDVLSRLPEGLQSELGEGGVRLSGGQGQRVRLGRALLRKAPRLVLLDEPFRGLERGRRQELLRRSRAHWQGSTLLLVSHDVADTIELDRVVVVEGGRIVEVGCPKALALDPGSRYGQKLAEARELRAACWQAAAWRRLSVSQGKLTPTGDPTDGEAARALG